MSCPALALNTPKPKRGRFSPKHKTEGDRLAQLLRETRRQFPGFASHLNELIDRVLTHSERSRSMDREKVLSALREWEFGLTRTELVQDTGLTDWDIRQVIAELLKRGQVIEHRELRAGLRSRQWCITYRLK